MALYLCMMRQCTGRQSETTVMIEFLNNYLLTILIFLPTGRRGCWCCWPRAQRQCRWTALGTTHRARSLLSLLLLAHVRLEPRRRATLRAMAGRRADGAAACRGSRRSTSSTTSASTGFPSRWCCSRTFICVLACLASWNIEKMTKGYFALFLFLETGILGVFLSLDFFLFYVFFEVSLLPMYFLIGIWGGPRKEYAAIKFFLYTLVGSVGLLIVLIGMYLYSQQTIVLGRARST